MKTTFFSFLLLIMAVLPSAAQNTSVRITALIAQNDFYRLDHMTPETRDSLPEVHRLLADAITGSRFNELPKSCEAIGTLLNNHIDELDGPTQSMLFMTLLGNLRIMGETAQAAGIAAMLQGAAGDPESRTILGSMAEWFGALSQYPKTSIEKPAGDIELPLYVTTERIRNALGEPQDIKTLYTDVEIGGRKERFIFDTGCSNSSFVSQEFADSHGIRVIYDSILVGGAAASAYARTGVIDSMRVGDIIVRNPKFLIAPPNEAIDTLYKVNAVLGSDFMSLVGEVQICPNDGKVIIPAEQTDMPSSGRNLSIDTQSGQYSLSATCDGSPVVMIFDTGASRSSMTPRWFERNKERVLAEGSVKDIGTGGFGGVMCQKGYSMPHLTFGVGDNAEIHTINVIDIHSQADSPMVGEDDGWLGTDFVLGFDKVTVNFDKMFVITERFTETTDR